MIRTFLILGCFAAHAFGSVVPRDGLELNETAVFDSLKLNWDEIKKPLVYEQQSRTFNRLLIKLDLYTIFPFLSSLDELSNNSAKTVTEISLNSFKESRPLEYHLFNDNREIYFLSAFPKPTNLVLNFNLAVRMLNERFQKKVTVNNHVSSINYPVNFVFTFTAKNATFAQVLASEFAVLRYFRRSLWGKPVLFLTTENHNLDILSLKPFNGSFIFEIGSSESWSGRLQRLLIFKDDNAEHCETARIDELDWFEQETSLSMDLCSIKERETNYDYSADEDYSVEADYDVAINGAAKYKVGEIIVLAICVLTLILLLGVFVVFIYKSIQIHIYVSSFTEQVGHK